MMELQDISALISIRNFLVNSIDNLNIKLSKEEIRSIQNKITYFDRQIVENSLKLDLSKNDNLLRSFVINATEDTKLTMEKLINEDSKPATV